MLVEPASNVDAWEPARPGSDPYREPVAAPKPRSRFGGLWTDMSNAEAVADGKLATGRITEEEHARLRFWIEKGYVVLQGAVDLEAIDELKADVERVWREGHSEAWISAVEDGVGTTRKLQADDAEKADDLVKLLDIYEYLESARRVCFAPALVDFLELIFERPPMAFQSLSFNKGSKQAIHQDTAFVRVSSPLELAASWIALEDVHPNTGELHYYEGSHKFREFLFEGQWKWHPPGNTELGLFYEHLQRQADEAGLEPVRFHPKKGDALIWSADLAHGGSPYTDETKTRKSLVTHYCPSNCHPMYCYYGRHTGRQSWSNRAYWTAAEKYLWRAGSGG